MNDLEARVRANDAKAATVSAQAQEIEMAGARMKIALFASIDAPQASAMQDDRAASHP